MRSKMVRLHPNPLRIASSMAEQAALNGKVFQVQVLGDAFVARQPSGWPVEG